MVRGVPFGILAAFAWVAAGWACFGGNMDTFGLVILIVLFAPVVGGIAMASTAKLVERYQIKGSIIALIISSIPAAVLLGGKWIAEAPKREERRVLSEISNKQLQHLKDLGWVESKHLKRYGGSGEGPAYKTENFAAAVADTDRLLGSSWSRIKDPKPEWARRAEGKTLWVTAEQGSQPYWDGVVTVRLIEDREMVKRISTEIVNEISRKRSLYPTLSKWALKPIDLPGLRKNMGIVEIDSAIVRDAPVVMGDTARVRFGIGRADTYDFKSRRFAYLNFRREGALWRVASIEPAPAQKDADNIAR